MPRFPEALQELSQAIKEGKLKYRESVIEGLENAVEALEFLVTSLHSYGQLPKVLWCPQKRHNVLRDLISTCI